MSQRLLCFVALSVWLRASAAPPPGYYDFAAGKMGPALRQALHVIISPHRVIPYAGTVATNMLHALTILDEDPENTNNVISRLLGGVNRPYAARHFLSPAPALIQAFGQNAVQ